MRTDGPTNRRAAPPFGVCADDFDLPQAARQHPSEDDLELYALKRLAEPDLGRVEEHLLVCEECRTRLTETGAVVSIIRDACRESETLSKG
jgi:predicted anti-sigma-YlaC factor YlaD